MKEEGIIKVERREHASKGANGRLRDDGYLPGNIYGKGIESIPISLKKDELKKNVAKFGKNSVFKLDLDGEKKYNVVIREIQNAPMMKGHLHVDFQKIILSAETDTDIPIKLVGQEFIDAKKLILLQQIHAIPVKGLPRKMPEAIEIDVSKLQAGDSVTIGSIEFPKGIASGLEPEQIVLTVGGSNMPEPSEESNIEKE